MSLATPGRGRAGDGELKAIAFAVLTGLTIAAYSLADGLGVRESGHEFAYIAWLFVFSGLPMPFIIRWRRGGELKIGALGGLISGFAYAVVIWSMAVAPIAMVVSLRETSVLIAAAIGSLFLKESFGRRRIAAAAVIVAGARGHRRRGGAHEPGRVTRPGGSLRLRSSPADRPARWWDRSRPSRRSSGA
jgi:drug/metabolite transporter (DMT)-like permease